MKFGLDWIDWVVIAIPLIIVLWIGQRCQKYMKGVADFLAAGRLGGRYVVAVASGESALGLITVIALLEVLYASGFAVNFWSRLGIPLAMFLSLTGFCTYRFRETKALTLGQYLEMRYSRKFRILAAILQAFSGIMNYAIFPAVGSRFLIYYMNLPTHLDIGGWQFPTIGLLMFAFLSIALFIVMLGGQITIMVTDCVQGLISYPLYLVVLGFIFYQFSWSSEMAPALLDRPPCQSFVNPFDVSELHTFNMFYVCYGLFVMFMNRISWSGSQGFAGAAKSAHEQKMAGLLGSWRGTFSSMVFILLAVAAYTYLHHNNYAKEADNVHRQLTIKAISDLAPEAKYHKLRKEIIDYAQTGQQSPDLTKRLAGQQATTTKKYSKYQEAAYQALAKEDPRRAQSLNAVYNQMTVTIALREMLPTGITGALCALMILLMVSTDTSYMHSWGSILIQDILLPLRKKPFTPRQQIWALRIAIALVCIFVFMFSLLFQQNDYIMMFLSITGAIWYGGASTVLVLGLYWKRGTTTAAYVTLIFGSSIALLGLFGQQYWVSDIYPALVKYNLAETLNSLLQTLSSPIQPYINWKVTSEIYPINSIEQNFITMLASIAIYVGVSLLSNRKFNLDRMLHRWEYSESPGERTRTSLFSRGKIYQILVGIDDNYSKGDKILAWSVFIYSFVWIFLIGCVAVVIWNWISPWSDKWWLEYFYITNVLSGLIIGAITIVWFSWGGVRDLRRLFQSLKQHHSVDSDDGRVEHNEPERPDTPTSPDAPATIRECPEA